MKTVTLNDTGYTADGKWRLVLVEPTRDLPDGDTMIAQLAAMIEPLEKEVIELREMVASLQVKADRYDFLARKVCVASGRFSFINLPEAPENWRELKSSESLDIAIDAAIDAARGGV